MPTTTKAKTIDWTGQSGQKYRYQIYSIDTSFRSVPGNYVFAKETRLGSGSHVAIYVGETSDLSERFDNHHKMQCIKQNGATHIHVHQNNSGQLGRRHEEADIIAKWHPICNG